MSARAQLWRQARFSMSKPLCKILFGKEVETMMAMLWTNQILLGKKTFEQVPRLLREQVAEMLTDAGYANLGKL